MPRTVPSLSLQNPGNLITASLWNTGPKAVGDFYLSPPMFRGRQSAPQTFASGVWTAITLDATDVDTDSGHSNVFNNTRYTAQVAGWYLCLGFAAWQNSNAQADIYCGLAKNGNLLVGTAQSLQKSGGDYSSISSSGMVSLRLGDYVEVWGMQDTGANYTSWATNTDLTPCLNMVWMHD